MQLGRDRAGLLVQEPVDHGVDVFVGGHRLRPVSDALRHAIEPLLQRVALVAREHARFAERLCPRLGEAHVVRPEPEVGADGPVDCIEQRRRAAGESTAPEFMRSRFGSTHGRLTTG